MEDEIFTPRAEVSKTRRTGIPRAKVLKTRRFKLIQVEKD